MKAKKPKNARDMSVPEFVRIIGGGFILAAARLFFDMIAEDMTDYKIHLILCLVCLGIGGFLMIWHKNRWVRMINKEEFDYSTISGKITRYRFDDITVVYPGSLYTVVMVGEERLIVENWMKLSSRLRSELFRFRYPKKVSPKNSRPDMRAVPKMKSQTFRSVNRKSQVSRRKI